MKIDIWEPDTDATRISGFTIVIDVFRAFSTNCYVALKKPKQILAVRTIEKAFELKNRIGQKALLIGERGGIKIDGFDYGNSPSEIADADIDDRIVIHTTSAGTKGLLRQQTQDEVICGSFLNVDAVINHIHQAQIDEVNLFCTASRRPGAANEDYECARFYKARLENTESDFLEIKARLNNRTKSRFGINGFAPRSDFDLCMALNRFGFFLAAIRDSRRRCCSAGNSWNKLRIGRAFITTASTG